MNIGKLLLEAADAGVVLFCQDGQLGFELSVDEFPAALKQKVIANKEAIIDYLSNAQVNTKVNERPPITVFERSSNVLPCSFAQQRLWLIDQMDEGSSHYNIASPMQLTGYFDPAIAEVALTRIIERHEPLRTVFVKGNDGGVLQLIRDTFDFKLKVVNLSQYRDDEQQLLVEQAVNEDTNKPFDLTQDLMLRCTFIRLSDDEGVLLLNMHHIASDGWSVSIVVNEFISHYKALLLSTPNPLPDLAIQYADYAKWQQQYLNDDVLAEQLDYWANQLDGLPQVHSLPLDRPRPIQQSFAGASFEFNLDSTTLEALKQVAMSQQITLFMLLQGMFALLLSRYSNRSDIVMGTPVANRLQKELEPLVGFFVNTLVLRTQCHGDDPLVDYLKAIKTLNLDAQQHQDVTFEQLVELINPDRSIQFTPLFQVMFSMNTHRSDEQSLSTLSIKPRPKSQISCKFELILHATEMADGLKFAFEYNTALFDQSTIGRMSQHLLVLLQGVGPKLSTDSGVKLHQLPWLTEQERHYLLYTLNDTQTDFGPRQCLHQLFIEQVAQRGDAIAIIDFQGQLSYRQLFALAYGLSFKLLEQSVQKEELIGVKLAKGRNQVIATLAVLMAGGAYLPLELSWPQERCERVLHQGGVRLVIDEDYIANAHCFDGDINAAAKSFQYRQSPEDLAYVIFTSGSTGTPKGVAIEHHSAVNTLLDINQTMEVTSQDLVLAVSALSFDLSVYDIFGVLGAGAVVVFPEHELSSDPIHWAQLVSKHQITLWNTVPISAELLVEQFEWQPRQTSIRIVMQSGDWVPPTLAKRLWTQFPEVNVYSLGGATEGSIWSIIYPITEDTSLRASVPYGKPMSNQHFYVLTEQLEPCPIGVAGQLHIGGVGVAREYFNDLERTAASYIQHHELGERLYKTGDMGRYMADGNIEFIGRLDDQVKLRGFRIELGEIEHQLELLAPVQTAIALVQDKQIVAYVTTIAEAQNQQDLISELSAALKSSLPSYMVPTAFVLLDKLPLTSNGKVDKKALPKPTINILEDEYVAPQTQTELLLVDIWASLLKIAPAKMSVNANFFASGGDSILSIQMVSRGVQAGLTLTSKQLFSHQTIVELAFDIDHNSNNPQLLAAPQHHIEGPMPLLPVHHWFFDDETSVAHFNQSVLLAIDEQFKPAWLNLMVEQLIKRHDALRLVFTRKDLRQGCVWQAQYQEFDVAMTAKVTKHQHLDSTDFSGLSDSAEQIQTSLSLSDAPLFRVVYFSNNSQQARLLLVLHHLLVDGVSWRVLLSDINQMCMQLGQRQPLTLAAKTSSYQQWGEFLSEYANSAKLQAEKDYWLGQVAQKIPMLPQQKHVGKQSPLSAVLNFELNKHTTSQLLQQASKAYRTQINELLLSALLLGVNRWCGNTVLRVDLESHGRNVLSSGLDLSQTVGWFTTFYPLTLQPPSMTIGALICAVKESVRAVPEHGMGYGVLKYLSDEQDFKQHQPAEILFNYLGQFDQVVNDNDYFSIAQEPFGTPVSPLRKPSHGLIFNGAVSGDQLRFGLNYATALYSEQEMLIFGNLVVEALETVVNHCLEPGVGCYTPTDFPLATVSQSQLNQWQSDIQDLYPATAMQQGLLFHSNLDPSAYATQLLLTLENVNSQYLKQAWQQLIDRHDILRTAFVSTHSDTLHQLVVNNVQLLWFETDISEQPPAEQNATIEAYRLADKARGFELQQAPLMRVSLWHLGNGNCKVLWTHHHALLDGWCLPLVFTDLAKNYQAYSTAKPVENITPPLYRDYISWLAQQDKSASLTFWQNKLADIEAPTPLPLDGIEPEKESGLGYCQLTLDQVQSDQLAHLARTNNTTVNIVLQAAWAYLLSRYSNEATVVFGATVSGRPAQLVGVEQMMGLFINTVAVRVDIDRQMRLSDWLQQLHQSQIGADEHGYLPLTEVAKVSAMSAELFDSLLVFENYPADEALSGTAQDAGLKVIDSQSYEGTNYGLSLVASFNQTLKLKLEFQQRRFGAKQVSDLLAQLKQILLMMSSNTQNASDLKVGSLSILSAAQKHYLTDTLNQGLFEKHLEANRIDELFALQARKTPQQLAVVFEHGGSLSYDQLNRQANQLAAFLISQGVGPETLVGLAVSRTPKMMVGMLAILKAGGAYVPLDPDYPASRLQHMIADSNIKLLLTEQALVNNMASQQVIEVVLDCPQFIELLAQYPDCDALPVDGRKSNDLAYVMYTSGSTGLPKGVMIEHCAVTQHLNNVIDYLNLTAQDRVLQFASMSFDTFNELTFAGLAVGACIHFRGETVWSAEEFFAYVDANCISITDLVPVYLTNLVENWQANSLTRIVVGGEALPTTLVKRWCELGLPQHCRLINAYGPTEATITTTVKDINAFDQIVSIGRPYGGRKVYLLDDHQQLVPFGAIGQLYIGGDSLARGYHNQPELTALQFIKNPFSDHQSERLYATGDRMRYLADGSLTFVGRVDSQVKVRGFRIELTEVEYQLLQIPAVKAAAVIVREAKLAAYVCVENNITIDRQTVSKYLPQHMMPATITVLAQMPMTVNGKIDKKNLPIAKIDQVDDNHLAPTTETEKVLANIWAQLFKMDVNSLSINDNFFALGGDSIMSLQVVSRAAQAGLEVSVKQLFEHPSIVDLSKHIGKRCAIQATQTPVIGDCELLPIQHEFFSDDVDLNHFNQAILLTTPSTFKPDVLVNWMTLLMQRHDALRLQFSQVNGQWRAQHQPLRNEMVQQSVEVVELDDTDFSGLAKVANNIQTSLCLSKGPLFKMVYFSHRQAKQGRLMLLCHHLVIDGMSWRILLQDIEQLALAGDQSLAPKTTSYQQWAELLREYANSKTLAQQKDYWYHCLAVKVPPLPHCSANKGASSNNTTQQTVSFELDVTTTSQLLQQAGQAYRTQINELLLAGLWQGLSKWAGVNNVRIDLEGHGRETISSSLTEVDLSETLGWFTTIYPLTLSKSDNITDNIGDIICTVKESLRAVPDKGIGYGILKYLCQDLQDLPSSPVLFNYLGQFDQVLNEQGYFSPASESVGKTSSDNRKISHGLSFNGMVSNGQLKFTLTYDTALYDESSMTQLANSVSNGLKAVIEHCMQQASSQFTPSDFPLFEISQSQLRQWQSQYDIEDIYPATAMQQGMLYHSQLDPSAYVTQLMLKFDGPLNSSLFKSAWLALINRHAIFRTAFVTGAAEVENKVDSGKMAQLVLNHVQLPWQQADLSDLSQTEQQQAIEVYRQQDKQQGFTEHQAPLMRLCLWQLGADSTQVLWTCHHALTDGWCLPLVFSELIETYHWLMRGKTDMPTQLQGSAPAYRDYIVWLQHQDKQAAQTFWQHSLEGVDEITPLPGACRSDKQGSAELSLQLSKSETQALQKLAKQCKTTMNIIVQAAWSIILNRYSHSDTVVFGTTVSGRPAQLAEVEQIIGLFINTLPVRVDINANQSLLQWLGQLHQAQVSREQFSYLPLTDIQRSVGFNDGLFDSLLVFENYPVNDTVDSAVAKSELKITDSQNYEGTNYGLALIATIRDVLTVKLEYACDKIDSAIIEALPEQLHTVLTQMTENAEMTVADFSLLTPIQQQALVNQGAVVDKVDKRSFHQRFTAQVYRSPNAVALTCLQQEGLQQLTYLELNQRANQLAHYLMAQGVGPQSLVGIAVPRCADMVIALLAVLKTGAAYVPLDPSYPKARLEYIVKDTELAWILCHSGFSLSCPVEFIELDSLCEQLACQSVDDLSKGDVAALAYVLYTSGSTGKPKGVMVEHQQLGHYLDYCLSDYFSDDITGAVVSTPLSFDATITSLLAPLLAGKQTVLLSEPQTQDSTALYAGLLDYLLDKSQCWLFKLTPAHLQLLWQLIPTHTPSGQATQMAHKVVIGGEQLYAQMLSQWRSQWLPNARFINEYGPTETVVGCSTYQIKSLCQGAIPIGQAINNCQLKVLDSHLAPAPMGAIGELYIGGAGVTRGYINQPQLTAQRFIEIDQQRWYKTGDLVRYQSSGDLVFVGRIDEQVKVRGFRIELGEIEQQLLQLNEVTEAAAVLKDDHQLLAYCVSQSSASEIRSKLEGMLPAYMVPSNILLLEQMPLTANGKIDKKSLPAPANVRDTLYQAPVSDTEIALANLWSGLLDLPIESIGNNNHFFALGGHSLLSMRLLALIRNCFTVELTIADIFAYPLLRDMAGVIDNAGQRNIRAPITPIPRNNNKLPSSFSQARLWFIDQMQGPSSQYNMPAAIRIEGKFDVTAAEQAFSRIIARHEPLRTGFMDDSDGVTLQVIRESFEFTLPMLDLTHLSELEQEQRVRDAVNDNARSTFDLKNDLLLRGSFIQLSAQCGVLLFNVHHIASDGWSMGIIVDEFSRQYQAIKSQQPDPLLPLTVQYADYARWQRDFLQTQVLPTQLNYWQQQLAGIPQVHNLPLDYDRPAVATFAGQSHIFSCDKTLLDGIKQLALEHNVTLFMVLHGAFALLLSRYSNTSDIVIGTPVANRLQQELEPLVGFFVNTLVLRVDCDENASFSDYLQQLKTVNLNAQANQDMPFEYLVEKLSPQRSAGFSPLFQIMFTMDNTTASTLDLPDMTVSPVASNELSAKFELTLNAIETKQGLVFNLDFNTALFAQPSIEKMAEHLLVLLQSIVVNPSEKLAQLSVWDEKAQKQLLSVAANPTPDVFVHQLVEQQAAKTPDALAVQSENQCLSYGQLNRQANQLAHYLMEHGVTHETLVGLCVERSVTMIVSVLAIFKAGGVYVPLDPELPRKRLDYQIKDSGVALVLSQSNIAANLTHQQVILLDKQPQLHYPDTDPQWQKSLLPNNLAYVIYTSGSTGQPKGVMVEHRNLTHSIIGLSQQYGINADSRVWQFVSVAFDVSVSEIFMSLCHGASIHLGNKEDLSLLKTRQITHLSIAAGVLSALTPALEPTADLALKALIVGGESSSQSLIDCWLGVTDYFLAYGPTETTICSSTIRYDRGMAAASIGRPLPNVQYYVMSSTTQMSPQGAPGELYIGGAGVARGYLNQDELTTQRFVDNPFAAQSGEKLYRTGDLVRYLADGQLVFIGRVDDQVKIRGSRIEPDEIVRQILTLASVDAAVVMAKEDHNNERRLVAYIVSSQAFDSDLIKQHLSTTLPEYMVPSAFVLLDELPLTVNGKVDKKALPEPQWSAKTALFEPPLTPTEQRLVQIWAELLKIDRNTLSVTANLFDLGCHSLLLLRAIALLAESNIHLTIKQLYEYPTIRTMAKLNNDHEPQASNSIVKLNETTQGTPIYLFHPMGGRADCYRALAISLQDICPVLGVQAPFIYQHELAFDALENLAQFYVDAITEYQPTGPYRLAGWSLGGNLAYLVARQLTLAGEQVEYLAAIDSMLTVDSKPPSLSDGLGQLIELVAGDNNCHVISDTSYEQQLHSAAQWLIEHDLNQYQNQSQLIMALKFGVNLLRARHQSLPLTINGQSTLLYASENSDKSQILQTWQSLIKSQNQTIEVIGEHKSMMEGQSLVDLTKRLRTDLCKLVEKPL